MIFGITLKHFAKLVSQGDNAKANAWAERLLTKTSNKKFKSIDISEMTFSKFVDLERYVEENDYISFCNIFVRKKFFETIYVHNLRLILEDYNEQKTKLFERYQYIFDPPQYGEPAKETVGSELRNDFVKEMGSYTVLMDLVCKGEWVHHKAIEQWKLLEFLYVANYLSGQKILENVK